MNIIKRIKIIKTFSIINFILLISLNPWWIIENRTFDHMSVFSYWGFNLLIVLVILIGIYALMIIDKDKEKGIQMAHISAWLYFLLMVLDLLKIFPTSPVEMSKVLIHFEIVIIIVSLYIIFLTKKHSK